MQAFACHSIWPFHQPGNVTKLCDFMQLLLSPGNSAGECLPLNGSTGHVDIRLRQKIVPHAVTIEHLPRSLAFDISSAPKDILIYAFADTPYLTEHLEERLPRALYLGRFQYDIEVRHACPRHSSKLEHHSFVTWMPFPLCNADAAYCTIR